MAQQLIAAAIVAAAFGYSVWALLPAGWRLALRRRLGLPTPAGAGSRNGCGGCSGCAGDPAAPPRPGPPAAAVVTLHRRRPAATPPRGGSADAAAP
ncbi:MAG: hypothetical protein JNL87_03935 [Burkholderiaceae bacterium]|nr:hypothetical protein [Burkholderiaceae bacterium]